MDKFKFARCYDYCATKDDYSMFRISNRAIKCKYRIHTGVGVSILSVLLILLSSYLTEKWLIIASFLTVNWIWFIYMMRMDFNSVIQVLRVKKLIKSDKKSLLDKIMIHINEYGKHLLFNTKYHYKTKIYPFDWLKTKITFKDKKGILYQYKITNKEVKFVIRDRNNNRNLTTDFELDSFVDLTDIVTIKQFQNKIREHFLMHMNEMKMRA